MKSVLESEALDWPERFRVSGAHVLEATDQIVKCLPPVLPASSEART